MKNGFLTIIDRYARFAKFAGEMVSLTSVETEISNALNQLNETNALETFELAACAVPDARSGEAIALAYHYPITPAANEKNADEIQHSKSQHAQAFP